MSLEVAGHTFGDDWYLSQNLDEKNAILKNGTGVNLVLPHGLFEQTDAFLIKDQAMVAKIKELREEGEEQGAITGSSCSPGKPSGSQVPLQDTEVPSLKKARLAGALADDLEEHVVQAPKGHGARVAAPPPCF